jgi:predicted methyltransferase
MEDPMRHIIILVTAAFAAALAATASVEARGSSPIAAAVADASRPDADRARDADRKPGATLEFAELHPGERVAELLPGQGYFTRLFSLVAGKKGKVYAFTRPRPADAPADTPDYAAPIRALAADPHYGNIAVSALDARSFSVSEPVDMVWTSQNYHDLHNIPNLDVVAFDKAVFNALKPGGLFIVLDHTAAPASGDRDTSTLHRIDPETVKKEAMAAGFSFVGASEVLKNGADDHTLKVFDPAIRGKTDQFILKFRKPK